MEKIYRVDDHMISNNVAFWHEYTQKSLYSLLLSFQNPNDVRLVAWYSQNIQVTSKGS